MIAQAQAFAPLPDESERRILCYYFNASSHLQIIRIAQMPNLYFERVVFPKQRLLFEALPEAYLEIHTCVMPSAILSDKLLCKHLRVDEGSHCSLDTTCK